MLTFLKLGKKGNLGNQLFQIASTVGIAKTEVLDYVFPYWKYSKFFENELPELSDTHIEWREVKEQKFEHHRWDLPNNYISLNGWLQSEKYFSNYDVKDFFSFKKDFEEKLVSKFDYLFSKPSILITVRRGDFVDNKNYFQLPYKFYFTALLKYFPNFCHYNLIFASDDIDYCKYHFKDLPNSFFLEGLSAIEQLCVASKCSHFIISNSTFSWWVAKLGEKKGTKIICPIKNFDGSYAKIYNDKDFYPEKWIKHDFANENIPLKYILLILKGELYKYNHIIKNYFHIKRRSLKQYIKKKVL